MTSGQTDPQQAVREAVASLRLDGLEPSPEAIGLLDQVADGELTTEQARQQLLDKYKR